MNTIVRTYLIDLARQRTNQIVIYQNLSNDCNLGFNMQDNPSDRTAIGVLLGEISGWEYNNNRPLLSSLVKRAGDNYEGDGFYKLAESLGFGSWRVLKREGVFEVEQMNACIEFWRNETNYLQFRHV